MILVRQKAWLYISGMDALSKVWQSYRIVIMPPIQKVTANLLKSNTLPWVGG
jgi:hypothetical protein